MEDRFMCCLCGQMFYGWGNNPWPLVDDETSRCCDDCNSKFVILARIQLMRDKKKG